MYHTQALILRKDEWGEADWLISALSRDFGKIRLRVQGARKHGAKLQGHIEPGSISELSFVVGRNGYRLVGAELKSFFRGALSSPLKLSQLIFLFGMLDGNLYEDRDNSPKLFDTTKAVLSLIDGTDDTEEIKRLFLWYQVRFFDFLGLMPSLSSPEAKQCQGALSLNSLSLDEVKICGIESDSLARDVRWLINCLGGAVSSPSTIITGDFSI